MTAEEVVSMTAEEVVEFCENETNRPFPIASV
jgi:hypothetical protein